MIESFANTVIIELISKASSLVFINGGGKRENLSFRRAKRENKKDQEY